MFLQSAFLGHPVHQNSNLNLNSDSKNTQKNTGLFFLDTLYIVYGPLHPRKFATRTPAPIFGHTENTEFANIRDKQLTTLELKALDWLLEVCSRSQRITH